MNTQNAIQELFFAFLSQYQLNEEDLDYSLVPQHLKVLQSLADVSNSGIQVFDIHKKETIFYSSNFGKMLGYAGAEYKELNYRFFESRMHPEEAAHLALNGIATFKVFDAFTAEEKLSHKVIDEYRMLNAQGGYVRLVEQYQVLELDKKGNLWLLLSIVDLSPDQGQTTSLRRQLLNFKTGQLIPLDAALPQLPSLTMREVEIVKLVRDGLLSKEISQRLSISVHTVNTHRQRILEKLGANNSQEAINFALRLGLLH